MASSSSLRTSASIGEQLSLLLGSGYVRPAEPQDAVAGVPAQWVAAPGSEEEISSVLQFANDARLSVVPRGGGTKLAWGNPPGRADVILSLARMNRIVEHAWEDLTVTVEAGCTFAELQRTLSLHGQHLALDPLWPDRATVGGVLSANDTGVLRLFYGGIRDLVIGITLALADGTLARSGGKVVKNVAGYDLAKLATGGLGTLGIVTRAVFRIHPLPSSTSDLSFEVRNMDDMQQIVLKLLDAKLSLAALQVRAASDAIGATIDIGLQGTRAGISAQEGLVKDLAPGALLQIGPAKVWTEKEKLWNALSAGSLAKCSATPSSIGEMLISVSRLAAAKELAWKAVVQATGIGWLRIDGKTDDCIEFLEDLRTKIERDGGSLVILHPCSATAKMDAWGTPGDAFPLMHALKRQFDPNGILNPGRYIGGI